MILKKKLENNFRQYFDHFFTNCGMRQIEQTSFKQND